MSPILRRNILIAAAVLLAVSLTASFWIGRESRRCALEQQVYRFGFGCIRPAPPILLDRGLQRT